MGQRPFRAWLRTGYRSKAAIRPALAILVCAFAASGCRSVLATSRRPVSSSATSSTQHVGTPTLTTARSGPPVLSSKPPAPTKEAIRIVIGGPTDQQVLGVMYAETLISAGYAVERSRGADTPQDLDRALSRGRADLAVIHLDDALVMTRTAPPLAAEVAKTATSGSVRASATTAGRAQAPAANPRPLPTPSPDPARSVADLNARLVGRDLQALLPSGAGHRVVLVAKRAAAEQEGWRKISDLRAFAFRHTLGGPFGCSTDDRCAVMLRRVYGLRFKEIVEFDNAGGQQGGPRAVEATAHGDVDLAFARDDDPALVSGTVVMLEDDRRALPAGNLVPIVRGAVLDPELRAVLDMVSAAVGPDELDVLTSQVDAGQPIDAAAKEWLRRSGIIGQKHS